MFILPSKVVLFIENSIGTQGLLCVNIGSNYINELRQFTGHSQFLKPFLAFCLRQI